LLGEEAEDQLIPGAMLVYVTALYIFKSQNQ